MRDQLNNIHLIPALVPVAAAFADNTVQTGATIDRLGFDSVTFAIVTGTLVDVDATFAVKVQHGDLANGTDMADCATTDFVGTIAKGSFQFDSDGVCRKIGYIGGKRFCRVVITPTNNSGAAPMAAIAVLGYAEIKPTANPPQ